MSESCHFEVLKVRTLAPRADNNSPCYQLVNQRSRIWTRGCCSWQPMSTVPFDATGASVTSRSIGVARLPAAGAAAAAEGAALRPGRDADRQHADARRPGDRGDRGALRDAARPGARAVPGDLRPAVRQAAGGDLPGRRAQRGRVGRRSRRASPPAATPSGCRRRRGARWSGCASMGVRIAVSSNNGIENVDRLRARRRLQVRPGARLRRRAWPRGARTWTRRRGRSAPPGRRCCSSAIRCTTARSPSARGSRSSASRRRSRPIGSRCASRPCR